MNLLRYIVLALVFSLSIPAFDDAFAAPRKRAKPMAARKAKPAKRMAKKKPIPRRKPAANQSIAAKPAAQPKGDLAPPFSPQKPSPYKSMAAKPSISGPSAKPPIAAKPKSLQGKPLNAKAAQNPKLQLASGAPPTMPKDGANAALVKKSITDTAPGRKDASIFWSKGGREGAEQKAKELNAKHPGTKHTSLEMIANNAPMKLPNGAATPGQQKAWGNASAEFGKGANGKVRMVMGEDKWRDDNFFNTVEKPILTKPLDKGGKVTQINVFEPDGKGNLKKTHRWYNDGSAWDGPGSQPGGEWNRRLAPKK